MVSALEITVPTDLQGTGLSGKMLAVMRDNAKRLGFKYLVAPVRPNRKHLAPDMPIEACLAAAGGWAARQSLGTRAGQRGAQRIARYQGTPSGGRRARRPLLPQRALLAAQAPWVRERSAHTLARAWRTG